jgi:hypothetical protein
MPDWLSAMISSSTTVSSGRFARAFAILGEYRPEVVSLRDRGAGCRPICQDRAVPLHCISDRGIATDIHQITRSKTPIAGA